MPKFKQTYSSQKKAWYLARRVFIALCESQIPQIRCNSSKSRQAGSRGSSASEVSDTSIIPADIYVSHTSARFEDWDSSIVSNSADSNGDTEAEVINRVEENGMRSSETSIITDLQTWVVSN